MTTALVLLGVALFAAFLRWEYRRKCREEERDRASSDERR